MTLKTKKIHVLYYISWSEKHKHNLIALIFPMTLDLVTSIANDGKDKEKEVDDVQVEIEGGKDVFFRGQAVFVLPSQHQLGVKHQVLQQQNGRHSFFITENIYSHIMLITNISNSFFRDTK